MKKNNTISIYSYNVHSFILLIDANLGKEWVDGLAESIHKIFEVDAPIECVKADDCYMDGAYAIHVRTSFLTFNKIRKYADGIGCTQDDGWYTALFKSDYIDIYEVM